MALVKCKECGEDVSTSAKACPKCGAPPPKGTSLGAWFVLFLIIYGVYAVSKDSPTSASSSAARSSASSSSSSTSRVVAPVPVPTWRNSVSTDPLTGKKSSYAGSPRVEPTKPMGFPYNDVEAWLGIGCDGTSEWAYIGFSSAPNLTDTDTQDGYSLVRTRIKWDDTVESVTLSQEWGASFLHFQSDASAIARLASSNAVLLELQWFGQQQAYFEFPLNGSSAAITEMRNQCSHY